MSTESSTTTVDIISDTTINNDIFKYETESVEEDLNIEHEVDSLIDDNLISTELKKIPLRIICEEAGLTESQANIVLLLQENVKREYLIDDWNTKLFKILAYILRLSFSHLTVPLPNILHTDSIIDGLKTQQIMANALNSLTNNSTSPQEKPSTQQLLPDDMKLCNENFAREAQNICRNKDLYLLLVNTAVYGNFNYKYYENRTNYYKAAEYFALSGFGESLDSTYQFSEFDMKTATTKPFSKKKDVVVVDEKLTEKSKLVATAKTTITPTTTTTTTTSSSIKNDMTSVLKINVDCGNFISSTSAATSSTTTTKTTTCAANIPAANFTSIGVPPPAIAVTATVSGSVSATATSTATANTAILNQFHPSYFGINFPYPSQMLPTPSFLPKAAALNFLTPQQILMQTTPPPTNFLSTNYPTIFQPPQPMLLANTLPFSSPYFNACFNETHINTSIIQQQQQYNVIGNGGPYDMLIYAHMLQKTQQITQTIFANSKLDKHRPKLNKSINSHHVQITDSINIARQQMNFNAVNQNFLNLAKNANTIHNSAAATSTAAAAAAAAVASVVAAAAAANTTTETSSLKTRDTE